MPLNSRRIELRLERRAEEDSCALRDRKGWEHPPGVDFAASAVRACPRETHLAALASTPKVVHPSSWAERDEREDTTLDAGQRGPGWRVHIYPSPRPLRTQPDHVLAPNKGGGVCESTGNCQSSSLPCRGVLPFLSGARKASGSETARVHIACRRCGRVAARGARAAT